MPTDDVKITVVERNGQELTFKEELKLTGANTRLTVPGIAADNVKDGIAEVRLGNYARREILELHRDSQINNSWFHLPEHSPSQQTNWSPLFENTIEAITFTNSESGSSGNEISWQFVIHEDDYTGTGNMSILDTSILSLIINGAGTAGLTHYADFGRRWKYVPPSPITLDPSKRYAFRGISLSGNRPRQTYVEIHYKEVLSP